MLIRTELHRTAYRSAVVTSTLVCLRYSTSNKLIIIIDNNNNNNTNTNNNKKNANVYGAVITAESLREFSRFI